MAWFKGSFHCHTTNSDGNVSPAEAARYYRAIGMDFVAFADHGRVTPATECADVLDETFIAIPGYEYGYACHVVGVDAAEAAGTEAEQSDWTAAQRLQHGVDRIRKAGGVPILAHPCWEWAYDERAMLQVTNVNHFEVYNAFPGCNAAPLGGRSIPERMWDQMLSAGRCMFGVANDDAHWYGTAAEQKSPIRYIPFAGTGWNAVWAETLTREAIRDAFDAGRFYASTGVKVDKYVVTRDRIDVSFAHWHHEKRVIEFIGKNGAVLSQQMGDAASYTIRGDEMYVRIRVQDTGGCMAFLQPVFLETIDRDIAWTKAMA